MIDIVRANRTDIPILAPLLDQYRQFYQQESNLVGATEFLSARILNSESVVFLAYYDKTPSGFCQLFTSYSSVSLQPILILNDLFVKKTHRNKKIGEALLRKAQDFCAVIEYKGLALETAVDNPAQNLYERLGWKKDVGYFHYFWQRPV
ncbi:MAG: GNAT family N-acetyltransferase [Eudoraea sp.]|uniref:GNAT family N-acetyltransferase n=1 Tax=Eudoraea sp. TaxID=1979955 RepID=UPI003C73EE13